MKKLLDETGLSSVWNKEKEFINTLFGTREQNYIDFSSGCTGPTGSTVKAYANITSNLLMLRFAVLHQATQSVSSTRPTNIQITAWPASVAEVLGTRIPAQLTDAAQNYTDEPFIIGRFERQSRSPISTFSPVTHGAASLEGNYVYAHSMWGNVSESQSIYYMDIYSFDIPLLTGREAEITPLASMGGDVTINSGPLYDGRLVPTSAKWFINKNNFIYEVTGKIPAGQTISWDNSFGYVIAQKWVNDYPPDFMSAAIKQNIISYIDEGNLTKNMCGMCSGYAISASGNNVIRFKNAVLRFQQDGDQFDPYTYYPLFDTAQTEDYYIRIKWEFALGSIPKDIAL